MSIKIGDEEAEKVEMELFAKSFPKTCEPLGPGFLKGRWSRGISGPCAPERRLVLVHFASKCLVRIGQGQVWQAAHLQRRARVDLGLRALR